MAHHQHEREAQTQREREEQRAHHVEGEGRHGERRKKVDQAIRRPSFTPQARTGQLSDVEPPEGSEAKRRKPGDAA